MALVQLSNEFIATLTNPLDKATYMLSYLQVYNDLTV